MFSIYYQIQFVKWLKPLEEIYTRDFPFTRDSFEEYYKLSRAYIAFKAITLLVNLLLLVSIALKNQYLAITWLAWGIIDVLFMLALLFYCISEWKLQHRYLVGILAWCVIKVHLVVTLFTCRVYLTILWLMDARYFIIQHFINWKSNVSKHLSQSASINPGKYSA